MTIYYLFKKIQDGELKLSDKFKVSKKAWKKGGSRTFLNLNSEVTVQDLLRGLIVQSGNDAAIVLAEGKVVAKGTPSELVKNESAINAYFGDSFKFN